MVIYKVNIEIKEEISDEWFNWMTTKHIPAVINTNRFYDFSFSKLIPNGSVAKKGYIKFQIMYFCRNMADLEAYKKDNAPALQHEHLERYKDQFIAEREVYQDLTPEMVELVESEKV